MKNCKSTNFLLFPGHKAGCACGNRRVELTRVGGGSFNFRQFSGSRVFGKNTGNQLISNFQMATRTGLSFGKKTNSSVTFELRRTTLKPNFGSNSDRKIQYVLSL